MKRRVVRIAAVGAAVVLTIGLAHLYRIASILVAYKARQVCSGVFVAGRDPAAVERDLEVDDLALLGYVDASVDARARATTASIALMTREAVHREATGCTLVFETGDAGTSGRHLAVDGAVAVDASSHDAVVDGTTDPLPISLDERLDAVVERAFDERDPSRPQRTRALLILHGGRIAAERYSGDITADTPLLGWSMAKSVMNALAAILVREGKWSLDMPLPIAAWGGTGDARGGITLDHALRMSTGVAFDEETTFTLPDVVTMLMAEPDMAAFAIDKPLEAAPGTRWQYSSGTSVILAQAMREAFARHEDYAAFPRHALFEPLGMTSAVLETDARGTFVGSSLMYATARDWARLGLLYLQDGVWGGVRILPEGWVQYTRTPAPADSLGRYGAHFWLRIPEGYSASGAPLPADAFHAAGHQGQFVSIVPSRGVVVVRLGATRHDGAWDQAAFVSDVLAALR